MDAAERAQQARQHIFAVNDAADFLDMVQELLQEERYNVTTTKYVPETFAQIAALQPALIIMDLAQGVQAGWTLLERLAKNIRVRDIPVIVLSTNPRYLETVQADPARFGGQQFLTKPFDVDTLLMAVDDLIGSA